MAFSSLFGSTNLSRASKRRSRVASRRNERRRRPFLESLESRHLLASFASITIDHPYYVGGQDVLITGRGFVPNESVALEIMHSDLSEVVDGVSSWMVDADAFGSFETSWHLSTKEAVGTSFSLMAMGMDAQTPDMAWVAFSDGAPALPAALTMDQADYDPGTTALISGSNFAPNETVSLEVLHRDSRLPAVGNNPWSVSTDSNGSFSTSWYVNPIDSVGESFVVFATGSQGDQSSTTFTDAGPLYTFYATSEGGQNLVSINQNTGVATTIGSFGYSNSFTGAFTPDGRFWNVINYGAQLAQVNLTTGHATPVGAPQSDQILAMDANPAGQLYAESHNGNFYSVNTATGQFNLIDNLGRYMCDLAFDNTGNLWGVDGTNSLYQLNPATGATLNQKAMSGVGSIMSIQVDPANNFYIADTSYPAHLYLLNPTTGATTLVGTNLGVNYIHGGDFLPSVPNSAPTISANSPSVVGNEGSTAVNSGSYSDANAGDNVSITASKGTISKSGTSSGTWNWSYSPTDNEAPNTVTITASDGNGGITTTTFQLTVNNVAPSNISVALSSGEINEGSSTALSGSFTDPGAADTHTLAINWGDGSAVQNVGLAAGVLSFSGISHSYLDGGSPSTNYPISVTVTDDDGGSASSSSGRILVIGRNSNNIAIFDANRNFVSSVPLTVGSGEPSDIAQSSSGDIFVSRLDGTILRFDSNLNFLTSWNAGFSPVYGIGVDAAGRVYAAGANLLSARVFNAAGALQTTLTPSGSSNQRDVGFVGGNTWVTNFSGPRIDVFNASSTDIGDIASPSAPFGIATAPNGDAWVIDQNNHEVRRISPAGATVFSFDADNGPFGPHSNQLRQIGVDSSGLVYIPDTFGTRVDVYTSQGVFQTSFSNGALSGPGGVLITGGLSITVNNVAPAVTSPSDQPASEGSAATINLGSFSEPGVNDSPWSVTVAWGDTTFTTFTTSTQGSLGTVTHTYAEEGNYEPTVTVTDKDNSSGTAQFGLSVSDPAVLATGGFTVTGSEGSSTASQTVATFTDPGGAEALTDYSAMIDWGDGSAAVTGTISGPVNGVFTVKGGHIYAEESSADHPGSNPYSITVTINHDSAPATVVVSSATIADAAVVATGGFSVSANEGSSTGAQTVASFTDPGGAESLGDYSASINWGDNGTSTGTITFSGGVFTVTGSHTYADNGAYNIVTTISHEASTPQTATSSATITNVPPTLTISGASSVNEGSTYTLNLSSSDPGADTIGTWSINWGDGSALQTIAGGVSSVTHIYADGTRNFTILADATDEDGTYSASATGGNAIVSPDPSFGNSGEITSDFFGSTADYAESMIIQQPDGKTIIGGQAQGGNSNIALARFNTDGSLDTTFGSGGSVVTEFGASEDAAAMVLDSAGRIVVGGSFGLARYSSNGVLDTSFGINGKLTVFTGIRSMKTDSQGRIVLSSGSSLLRLTSSGSVDTSFNGGTPRSTTAYLSYGYDMTVDALDRIVVTGYRSTNGQSDIVTARFTTSGALDTTFGVGGSDGDGVVTVDYGGRNDYPYKVVTHQGKILIAGETDPIYNGTTYVDPSGNGRTDADIALVQINDDGTLDTSFGVGGPEGDGKVQTNFNSWESPTALAVTSTGGILVAGGFGWSRYSSAGVLDTSIGSAGRVSTSVQSAAIAEDASGRVMLGGYYYLGTEGANFAVARYLSTGALDATYSPGGPENINGIATIGFSGSTADYVQDLVVQQSDGKIVVAGYKQGGNTEMVLARYLVDGTLDTTFGAGGYVITASYGAYPQAIGIDSSGRILVATSGYVLRYNSSGTPDNTFGSSTDNSTYVGSQVSGIQSMAVDSTGKVVVGGYRYQQTAGNYTYDFALVRLDAAGLFDSSFGTNGVVYTDLGSTSTLRRNELLNDIAIDSAGRIVAVGYSWDTNATDTVNLRNNDFLVVRYLADGSLDGSFGVGPSLDNSNATIENINGVVLTDFGSGEVANTVGIDGVGRIVAAGGTRMARYTSSGTLDTSFDGDGKANLPVSVYDLAIDSYDRIVGSGGSYISRVTATGAPDNTFAAGGYRLINSNRNVYSLALDASGRIVVAGTTSNVGATGYDFYIGRFLTGGLAVTVNNVAPTSSISGPTTANEGGSVTLTGSATDPAGAADPLTYSWSVTRNGSPYLQASGATLNLTFPDNGSYVATLTVDDGDGGVVNRSQSITVANLPPTANTDDVSTNEDTAVTINVLANDTDPAGASDPLTITTVTQGAHGTVVNNGNGTVTYTPALNYNGSDSFTYSISDGDGGTATGAVMVTINPVNDPPDGNDDSYTVAEDHVLSIAAPGVLANDTEPDGDTVRVNGAYQPSHGTLLLYVDGSFTYTPDHDFYGTDSFVYEVGDSHQYPDPLYFNSRDYATVTITVTPVNDAPTLTNGGDQTLDEGQTATNGGAYGDVDSANVTLTASIGTITQTGTNNGTWSWSYSTTDGPAQSQTVTITADDANGGVTTTSFQLTVNNVPPTFEAGSDETLNPPQAGVFARSGIAISDVSPDDTFLGTVNYGDSTGDQPLLINQALRTFNLNHIYVQQGPHTVTVTVNDDDGGTAIDSFNVDVILNQPPTISSDNGSVTIPEGTAATNTGHFNDPQGNNTVTLTASVGTVTKNDATGTWSWSLTTTDGPAGPFTVTITATDNYSATATTIFTYSVTNVAPTADLGNSGPVNEGSTATVQFNTPTPNLVTYQFTGSVYWYQLVAGGANPPLDGSIALNTPITGSFSYNPTVSPSSINAGSNLARFPGGTLQATIGDYTLTSGFTINLRNDSFGVDEFELVTDGTEVLTNGTTTYSIATFPSTAFWTWRLTDYDATVFSTYLTLPSSLPASTQFEAREMGLHPGNVSGSYTNMFLGINTLAQVGGAVIDPSPVDTAAGFHYAYDFDNDGTFDLGDGTYAGSGVASTATVPASYLADGPSTSTVRGRIIDKDGGFTDDTTTIVVNNVAPAVNSGPDKTLNDFSAFASSGSFTDPGADTWTATVDYGDATGVQPLALNADKTFSLNHNYAAEGTFTVTVTVTDDDGGSSSDTAVVTVNRFTVNTIADNTADDGLLTLREAIANGNFNPDQNTIRFNIPGPGVQTITIAGTLGSLPTIGAPLVIDGYTQPGASANTLAVGDNAALEVELNGVNLPADPNNTWGLHIDGNGSGSTIKGLVINRFLGHGIYITGSTNNIVQGNFLGTNAGGTGALGNANGITIRDGSTFNIVGTNGDGSNDVGERNVISGNVTQNSAQTGHGVQINFADDNVVAGNYIGTNAAGTAAIPNAGAGIYLAFGGTDNRFGTDGNNIADAAERNVISGNTTAGIQIVAFGPGLVANNRIAGNYIGTNATGNAAIANTGQAGIWLSSFADSTIVGTNGDGSAGNANEGNLISGNSGVGIEIGNGGAATNNIVAGNKIGTDVNGTALLSNGGAGVSIERGSSGNRIGTNGDGVSDLLERNLISGNNNFGVVIGPDNNASCDNNIVAGNYIGTNLAGTAALRNLGGGVLIGKGQHNTIGTNGDGQGDAVEGNVISGNSGTGINLTGASGTNTLNVVAGDFVGTNASGTAALANANYGISISNGANNNRIGTNGDGTSDGVEQNLISGNGWAGIGIIGAGTDQNIVAGNYIGTNAAGSAALSNANDGVSIFNGAKNNRIGTNADGVNDATERNVISGNLWQGVKLSNLGTSNNVVAGNFIGTDASGTTDLGNALDGIIIFNAASNNVIGGSTTAARNVISGNDQSGVNIAGVGSNGNSVSGNFIGATASGTVALGNASSGVRISGGATSNLVGGSGAAARNIVVGNTGAGILITDAGTNANKVQGNYLGVDSTGNARLPNNTGVTVQTGAKNNIVGTDGDGVNDLAERNVISGNASSGISISGTGTQGNVVAGNYIGTNAAGTGALANSIGITIQNGSTLNNIGTDANGVGSAARRNVISGNTNQGILIQGTGTNNNVVAGNYIGTDASGTVAVGNRNTGITIQAGASSNIIGTDGNGVTDSLEQNIISANVLQGVLITGAGTSSNVVAGNDIGTNAAGNSALGNTLDGVRVSAGATLNRIGTDGNGGNDAAEKNVISGNGQTGVILINSGTNQNVVAGNFIGTNAAGVSAIANALDGVLVSGGPQNNRVGTNGDGNNDALERNIISGNLRHGVFIFGTGSNGNVVAGNYIGTSASGSASIKNAFDGVRVASGAMQNRIGTDGSGGNDAAEQNLISGNGQTGVILIGSGTDQNIVAGNLIGINAAGTSAIPNTLDGVLISSGPKNNRVGTNADGISDNLEGNVLSGNLRAGLFLFGNGTSQNVAAGNWIGTNASGIAAIGNASGGVLVEGGASNNTVGGPSSPSANVIAFNGSSGVIVSDTGTFNNRITQNSIHDNTGLGIDLGDDGVTPNDSGDVDSGSSNQFQNYPVITTATPGLGTQITGSLNSLANTTFTLEFFANTTANPSGFGEGQRYLGSTTVSTDATGNVTFNVTAPVASTAHELITATATDPSGNTSEFSKDVVDNTPPVANPDSASANEDGPAISINLTANDTDADVSDDPEISSVNTSGTHGMVTINADNDTVTYNPNGQFEYLSVGQTATDTFSYTITDGFGGTSTAQVIVTIHGQNDGPQITVANSAVTTDEGGSIGNSGTFADIDLSDQAIISASIGTIVQDPGHAGAWTWTYTPPDGPDDSQLVTITADDQHGAVATTAFQLTVNNVAPVLDSLTATSVFENGVVHLTGTYHDAGTQDTHTLTIDWGEGSPETVGVSGGSFDITHQYLDDNPTGTANDAYGIGVTLTDDDTGTTTGSTTTTITNVAPVLDSLSATSVFENGTVHLTGTYHDIGTQDTHTLTINWGEGSPETVAISGGSFDLTHQYLDDNPTGTASDVYTIGVTLTDDDTGTTTGSTTTTITNVAPVLDSLSATSVFENGTVHLTGTYHDIGTQDTHTLTINWGEGAPQTVAVSNGSFDITHQYLDDNPTGTASDVYAIGVTLADDDTGTATGGTSTTITNVAPVLDSLSATSVFENGVVHLTGTYHDAGTQDTHTLTINWGEGSPETVAISGGSFDITHQYLDDNPTGTASDVYTIGVTLTDDDTGTATGSTTTTITNVAPVLDSLSATSVFENGTVHLTGTYHDIGTQDTHTLTINWGEGSPETVAISGGSFDLTHQYLDDNPTGTASDLYTIGVTLTDDDTGTATGSTTTTVTNVAPSNLAVSLTTSSINENGSTTLSGSFVDPGTLDVHTILVNWGGSEAPSTITLPVGQRTFSLTHQYSDDNPTGTASDVYAINVQVMDDDAGSAAASTNVVVNNVAPVMTTLSNSSPDCGMAGEGQSVTVSGSFTDIGTQDTHTAIVNWGDGNTTTATFAEISGGGSFTSSHVYASGGIYTATVTLNDDDSGTVTQSTTIVIVGVGVVNNTLYVIGTSSDDHVTINAAGSSTYWVHADFLTTGADRDVPSAGINRIVVDACAGNDQVIISSGITLPALIDGGEGNDKLNGGSGPNVILGGAGDDDICGGSSNDILIGGTGADRIVGNPGEDLIVAGYTDSDQNYAALFSLLAEWSRTDLNADLRTKHIQGLPVASGTLAALNTSLLNANTVHNDMSVDKLTGSAGVDWFFANFEDGGVLDAITDIGAGETKTDID